ncbi:CCNC [Cervus elaphus hippelaphus]|uniref:CCNC n=1 Tax=Cervus elaphus hippelaphus TaxID=46360 RepID=A0A212C622_CEREH|nr:CCNC [Cervus elaphus hippelaphus]
MAGNFWQSSHYLQWILDKQDLLKERQKDLKFLSEEEYWKLQIFFTNVIQALGEHLKLRQQVIATATVYFKRFYARYSLKSIDPVLMAPTYVFLASKVEVLECEFYLLELMCIILIDLCSSMCRTWAKKTCCFPLHACLHVACVVQQKDARQWFAELSVDMEKILEIIRVILKLYEQWKNFDERKEMATILSKMPKPKPPPNSEGEQGPNGSQNSSYSQS